MTAGSTHYGALQGDHTPHLEAAATVAWTANELLRELLEITALSQANTNEVTWRSYWAFAVLSLGHTSRPIDLELFAVQWATIVAHVKGIAYLCCTAAEHGKSYGRQQTHDCTRLTPSTSIVT